MQGSPQASPQAPLLHSARSEETSQLLSPSSSICTEKFRTWNSYWHQIHQNFLIALKWLLLTSWPLTQPLKHAPTSADLGGHLWSNFPARQQTSSCYHSRIHFSNSCSWLDHLACFLGWKAGPFLVDCSSMICLHESLSYQLVVRRCSSNLSVCLGLPLLGIAALTVTFDWLVSLVHLLPRWLPPTKLSAPFAAHSVYWWPVSEPLPFMN